MINHSCNLMVYICLDRVITPIYTHHINHRSCFPEIVQGTGLGNLFCLLSPRITIPLCPYRCPHSMRKKNESTDFVQGWKLMAFCSPVNPVHLMHCRYGNPTIRSFSQEKHRFSTAIRPCPARFARWPCFWVADRTLLIGLAMAPDDIPSVDQHETTKRDGSKPGKLHFLGE